MLVSDGCIKDICVPNKLTRECPVVDLEGGCVFPTFVDLHTHIDKGHTCERSRNPTGSLTGADSSTAKDASFWNLGDVFWRMDFSVRCAYAHGTSALRTHLINMVPKQLELTWPAFDRLRKKWKGKVELQAVSLVTLSFFRDEQAATVLADTVATYEGILGAAVCCSDSGGLSKDDWTTCDRDRGELLDRIFTLAKARGLLLDFHVDENGNERSRGLRDIAQKTIEHGYQGKVVCGHCCSLAAQSPADLKKTLALAARAHIVVVSLPLVNEWTQDRSANQRRTPRWRGVTTLQELQGTGVPVALASDNTRDQFYQYGDLDMLEVFTQGVRLGHLDRPIAAWPAAVTSVPAAAMKLRHTGRIAVGAPADLVLFRARRYSELLSRPQVDRLVLRGGKHVAAVPPDYRLLDYNPVTHQYLHATTRLTNESFRENQAGMGSARASLGGGSGVGEPVSYPDLGDAHPAAPTYLRGLSMALSSEGQPMPDGGARRRTRTGPGSVAHLMESNAGALPEHARLLEPATGSVTDSSAATSGSPLCVNGKGARPSWLLRRGEADRGLSAGSWGGQPMQGWQLSTVGLSSVVVVSMALGAGGAFLISRKS
eukprot:jgi/Ulvmu1/3065/UM015_0105.1